MASGRRDRRHRAGPPRQCRPVAGDGARSRLDGPIRPAVDRERPARLGGSGGEADSTDEAAGDRGGLERARDDQRHRPRGPAGPPGRSARLCRRGTLCPAPAGRCPGVGLRSARLLRLQILWPAPRDPLWSPRDSRAAGCAEAGPGAQRGAGPARDWHAEPRRDRRSGGGGQLDCLLGKRGDPTGTAGLGDGGAARPGRSALAAAVGRTPLDRGGHCLRAQS